MKMKFESALRLRDLKSRNGMSTEADDKKLIKHVTSNMFDILEDNSDEAKKGSDEAVNCSIHYEQFVGKNLTPVKEIEKACEYLLNEVNQIKKTRELSVIDTHLGHIECGVIAIDHRISDWLKDFSMEYKSPYEVHSLTDLINVKSAPPVNKTKAVRKACDNLTLAVNAILREIKKPALKGLFISNCDLNACESELHYIRALKDKKAFP